MKKVDVVIIGAGPAGMAAAIKLYKNGIKNIIVFERNDKLGGILNQCIHSGFGIEYYKDELTGPEYAERMSKEFLALNIPFKLNSMVIDLNDKRELTVSSYETGMEKYKAKSVILATGCRERTRENLEIAGTRPAGIFNAGQAQELINLKNYRLGKKVIIQGSGDIGLIMARRLTIEGYEVVKVFERLPYLSGLIRNKVQCLDDYNIPIEFNSQISKIEGKHRVSGVYVERVDNNQKPVAGTELFYECDTVLFSVGLIPEVELGKKAGVTLFNNFNPDVNNKFESAANGVFICGNSLHIHDLADGASVEGEKVAEFVCQYLKDKNEFEKEKTDLIPYKQEEKEEKFNEEFFKSLDDDKMVCTICPKGCIISENNYSCKRGKEFFIKEKKCRKRRIATTVYAEYGNMKKRLPIISEEEVNINDVQAIKKELRKIRQITQNRFEIKYDNKIIHFNTVI